MPVWNLELEEAPLALALSPKQQLLAVGTVDDPIVGKRPLPPPDAAGRCRHSCLPHKFASILLRHGEMP